MRVSVVNLVAALTPVVSSEVAPYLGLNLIEPARQLRVWRSTAVTQQTVKYNLGAAPTDPIVAVFPNANFTSLIVEGNNSDVWTTPPFTLTLTPTLINITGRYGVGCYIRSFPHAWVQFRIPAQTPVDAAPYFSLGGTWFGPALRLPRSLQSLLALDGITPSSLVPSDTNTFEDYQVHGPIRVKVSGELRLSIGRGRLIMTGLTDELAQWQYADRMWGGSQCAVLLDRGTDGQAWIMKNLSSKEWPRSTDRVVRKSVVLVEQYGP